MPRLLIGVLLLLLVPALPVRAQGEVVLYVGTEAVSRAEFEYYYKKVPGKTPEAYAASLAELRLKVRLAEEMGLDTLPAFRMQWAYYRGKMLKPYLADARKEEQEARSLYERGRQRLHTGDWVRIAHISKYLPQHVGGGQERAARLLMDSVYAALQAGADFAGLARRYSDDADSKEAGGVLPWMPVDRNVQEWADKLAALEKDKVSAPFYSPLGIHIVKWLDRKPCVTYEERLPGLLEHIERKGADSPAVGKEEWADDSLLYRKFPDWLYRMRELRDGLLVATLARLRKEETACNEEDLERFFRQHRSDYAWKLPRYKGAVIHCKDKKTAKAVKRYLKKKPASEWEAALERWLSENPARQVKMETGLFEIGKNKYVDKIVFKCGAFEPLPGLPHTFVMGKKLKKGPEDYRDIREALLHDWRAARDEARMKELKQRYKVEINQEVLKTVNNNGSN